MPPSEPSSTIRAVDSTQVAQADDFRARVAAISEPETKPLPVDGSVAQSMMPSGEATSAQDPPAECSASGTTIDELAQSITTAPPLHPQAPPTQAATTLCRYWAEGYCFRGALCWYKHSRDPASTSFAPPTAADALGPAAAAAQGDSTGPKSPKSPTAASLNAQASAFSPATTTLAADQVAEQIAQLAQEGPASDQKDGQTEETSGQVASDVPAPERQPGPSVLPEQPACMICYEMPATYGLLDSCSHSFCLSCIRQWRKGEDPQAPNVLSGVNKRCPMCRGSCLFITPASIFHVEGPAKSLLIEKYKQNLSRKPCNFFEATKNSPPGPFCKFGDDCHYAHVLTPGDDRYLFGGGFEMMSARARERRERREAQRMRRPFHSGPLGLTEAEEAELDYLRFFDVMIGNGNDPADWDRDTTTAPPRPAAARRYSDAGAGLRFPRFEMELRPLDSRRVTRSRRAQGDEEEAAAGLPQDASRSRSPSAREGSTRIRARANGSGLQVRSAEAARGTFSSSTRSDRRAAQRRHRREALEAQARAHARAQSQAQDGAPGSTSAATDPRALPTAGAGVGSAPDETHDEHSPGDPFELVGEEEVEDDPPSPSGQLFNLARAFEEGYERGGRWQVEDEDEHNEHTHDSGDRPGADDDDDQTGWSTDEEDLEYRVGPGGSIWLNGEEIFAGEYGSIWDDENDGHIWYYE